MNPRIWSTSPRMVYIQIAIMSLISISAIVCVLVVPGIAISAKTLLISTPFTSCLFLIIQVQYMELEEHQFVLKTILSKTAYRYDELKSYELKNEAGTNCLVIHLKKPLFFRRQFVFQGITKEHAEYLVFLEKIKRQR